MRAAKHKTQYWTPFHRRAIDFHFHYQENAVELGQVNYVFDLVDQTKKLRGDLTRSWLITFVGVVAILSGGLPSDSVIKLAGVELPATLLTTQVLAVLVSVSWGYTIHIFMSYLLANMVLKQALNTVYPESNEYFVAHKDARLLFSVMLVPLRIGFRSPLRERAVIWLNNLVAFLQIGLQWAVVVVAVATAFEQARSTGAWIPAALSGMSLALIVVTGLTAIFWIVVPVPYRMPIEEFNKTQAAPNEAKAT